MRRFDSWEWVGPGNRDYDKCYNFLQRSDRENIKQMQIEPPLIMLHNDPDYLYYPVLAMMIL